MSKIKLTIAAQAFIVFGIVIGVLSFYGMVVL